MTFVRNLFKNISKTEKIYLLILLLTVISLRFFNLGYSDYIQDETGTFFYKGGTKNTHMTKTEFLLNEAKGPLQVMVSYIPYLIVGNYDNALAQRVPFAIFGAGAVFVLYFLVKKITKDPLTAFIASFLFGVNGLIVAYGRVAQYQNLIFFFSFLSIYFYSSLMEENADYRRDSLLGTFFFTIALYAHWYAVFALIPSFYFYIRYISNSKVSKKDKIILTLLNTLLGLAITIPFFVPYLLNISNNAKNTSYAESILGKGASFLSRDDYSQFLLYNPFITSYFYALFVPIGLFMAAKNRRNIVFILWATLTILFFRFFVAYSGLHFYHMFIPLIIIAALGISWLLQITKGVVKKPFIVVISIIFLFLYFQTYKLFVEHKTEYPFENEKLIFFETKKLEQEDDMRHKTGFPHKRYWNEINDYINEQNKINNENLGYYSNEDKGISRIYMDTEISTTRPFYAVGIKRPYSLANDYKFPQFSNKSTIHTIENEEGSTVVKIYRVGSE